MTLNPPCVELDIHFQSALKACIRIVNVGGPIRYADIGLKFVDVNDVATETRKFTQPLMQTGDFVDVSFPRDYPTPPELASKFRKIELEVHGCWSEENAHLYASRRANYYTKRSFGPLDAWWKGIQGSHLIYERPIDKQLLDIAKITNSQLGRATEATEAMARELKGVANAIHNEINYYTLPKPKRWQKFKNRFKKPTIRRKNVYR